MFGGSAKAKMAIFIASVPYHSRRMRSTRRTRSEEQCWLRETG